MFEIIEPKHDRRIMPNTVDMLALLYSEGRTLEQLGDFIGVSRARIRQLLVKRGITSVNGGSHIRSKNALIAKVDRRAQRSAATQKKIALHFHCTYEALCVTIGHPIRKWREVHSDPILRAYRLQCRNARFRGIEWEFTLPEWWAIWKESGKWLKRGRGKGTFCMSRKADQGAYSPENVIIQTTEANSGASTRRKGFNRATDPLGLTAGQRHVYDLWQSGYRSPKAIQTETKRAGIGPILSSLRNRGLI